MTTSEGSDRAGRGAPRERESRRTGPQAGIPGVEADDYLHRLLEEASPAVREVLEQALARGTNRRTAD